MEELTPREEGRECAKAYGHSCKNPYPLYSQEYNEFESGRTQELRLYPDAAMEVTGRQKRLKELYAARDKRIYETKHKRAVDRYRRAKGE